ncbi:MAG: MoaD/ThiS family protein [Chloroflexota bacterium]|nr:MoaD/ThiS family protein [Chloroflexota bacterium]
MQVTLKLYAWLTDFLPPEARKNNRISLQLLDGATITEVLQQQLLPAQHCHLVLVNGTFVPPSARATHPLKDGDVLAIWPPVAGG